MASRQPLPAVTGAPGDLPPSALLRLQGDEREATVAARVADLRPTAGPPSNVRPS